MNKFYAAIASPFLRPYHPAQNDPKQKPHSIIFSVQCGHVGVKDVRELSDVVRKLGAAIGVLISLDDPTKQMRVEAGEHRLLHQHLQRPEIPPHPAPHHQATARRRSHRAAELGCRGG